MKHLLLTLFLSVSCFGITVSNITVSDVSHGSFFLSFTTDTSINAARVRYTASPATCTGGTGGIVAVPSINFSQPNPYEGALSGFAAGTTYQVCPEVSADGGNTWTTGFSTTVTTAPLPAVHPALPIPPQTFNYSYPDTTTGTCADTGQPGYCSVTVSASCSDFISDVFHAISIQKTSGTVINIPAGTICSGTGNGTNGNYDLNVNSPDVKTFNASAVNASTINLPNHGYAEGQQVVFEGNYSCISGCSGATAAVQNGEAYYVHVVDANDFQVYNAPAAQGGTQITLSPSGNNIYVAGLPRQLYWVVIRTATPDNQFVPAGTRTSPAWDSKIPFFVSPLGNLAQPDHHYDLFSFKDGDGNNATMLSNIYLMGIGFTYAQNPSAATSSDPLYGTYLYSTSNADENIVCDRCRFKGNGGPGNGVRDLSVVGWDGMNVAFTNSYFDGMHYFHGERTGFTLAGTSSTSFTISSGSAQFGAGSGTLANTASIAFNGTSTGQHQVFSYFDFNGQLDVILPNGLYPGATGTSLSGPCGGVSNCLIKAALSTGGGRFLAGASAYPTNSSGDNYFVEPIFSTASNGSNPLTLTGNAPVIPTALKSAPSPYELGKTFYSDVPGYIVGVRFYAVDTEAGRTVSLWDNSGNRLATANSPENVTNGWETVLFSTPQPISAGTPYVVSFYSEQFDSVSNAYQNGGTDNAPLHVIPFYVDTPNGSCNYSDAWPQDAQGRPAAGEVSCVTLSNGAISSGANGDMTTSQFFTEGCQCMIGGVGPGPWAMINNYVEGSGNMWHHDNSGGTWSNRGDYTYFRNTFSNPAWTMWGNSTTNPASDGNAYFTRQVNEWKGGKRIKIYGSIYNNSYNSVSPSSLTICFCSGSGGGGNTTDVDFQYNTIEHVAGGIAIGDYNDTQPERRYRFANNLFWDINGYTHHDACVEGNCSFTGQGWVFQGPGSMEDLIVDHNTFVGNVGSAPVFFWLFSGYTEGLQFTNNFAYVDGNQGLGQESGDIPNDSCSGLRAKALMDCKFTPSYTFANNALIGNGVTAAQIQSWFPNLTNYIPTNTSLSSVGWYNCPGSLCASGTPDFHLKSNYCAGCANPANDLRSMGADINALESAQGQVTLVGASNITSSSARITFDAPDAQGCPVDFSSSDPTLVNNFTRVPDSQTGTTRNITLSGLASGTVYYFRVNCAVQQPTGNFRTN